ncbi:MAG: bifunctional diaminohydroxyphosphoribosylaminopyrimidine deaminase/5-amino-6-(5-phosphoribosylamino)uracil reductase RibD [Bacteroidetes bacterium]|nr:bifunctional diaminohydroxyphosphoribosylaminopyrimidine deaminase/5-amino-6-(5-phosphoribosylamino)uracil reductase RibD [Bacteroidota bacterium]MBS1648590.1 bifunctional diaminohydroxyphosphoribosylaminopyrimidine deaminase/5-amino-6-(5-phosphoribosylamino)uracil reductase RibD [Bacteroidota bacterium]
MQRCLQLAVLGKGWVAPNPMVGAVLVYNNKIIGEGYHEQYGSNHAEVNCINSVTNNNIHLIEKSVLYVSLEPCNHFGKTPPCTNLILQHKIKKVVIGCTDSFEKVNGAGIQKLRDNGVDVMINILEEECKAINKRFFVFHKEKKPYIILKWAQTANKKIALHGNERLFITNEFTNQLVHKWRAEEQAIMVGFNTALKDNPQLNNRFWSGKNPVRLLIDKDLKLPDHLHLFNQQQKTVVFNQHKQEEKNNLLFQKINKVDDLNEIVNTCYELNIQSIIIEGGAKLLQSFIKEGLWNEARVITNNSLFVEDGLSAPELTNFKLSHQEKIVTDIVSYFVKQ